MPNNILNATDTDAGAVLEFSRPGGSAYYLYPGMSAAAAEANTHSGGQQISSLQAQALMHGNQISDLAEAVEAEDVALIAARVIPFLL